VYCRMIVFAGGRVKSGQQNQDESWVSDDKLSSMRYHVTSNSLATSEQWMGNKTVMFRVNESSECAQNRSWLKLTK
jgi:hypothetical protein